jgi:hypothetical protein
LTVPTPAVTCGDSFCLDAVADCSAATPAGDGHNFLLAYFFSFLQRTRVWAAEPLSTASLAPLFEGSPDVEGIAGAF